MRMPRLRNPHRILAGLLLALFAAGCALPFISRQPVNRSGDDNPRPPPARVEQRTGSPLPIPTVRIPFPAVEEVNQAEPVDESAPYDLKPGDPIAIEIFGPSRQNITEVIDEKGFVNLQHIGRIQAAGKTTSELENEIERLYIENDIFKWLTVNVVGGVRIYYVRNEVRRPGMYQIRGTTTFLQAIATAGGYSEFANPKRVKILRDGKTIEVNAVEIEDNPDQDFEIESGDVIIVPRSFI
jgi:polysaccharide export outer membrane protein